MRIENEKLLYPMNRSEATKKLRGMRAYHKLTELQKEWLVLNATASPWTDREELLGTMRAKFKRKDLSWKDIWLITIDPVYAQQSLQIAGSMLAGGTIDGIKNLISIATDKSNKTLALKAITLMIKAVGWTAERSDTRAYDKGKITDELEDMTDEALMAEAGIDPNEIKDVTAQEVEGEGETPQAETGT